MTELERTWTNPFSGLRGWLCEVDHKILGKRFIVTAFVFFILGGLEALAMRLQLARPNGHVVTADMYNQLFTMHGSTMMFLFAVPVMEGVGLYLVPLMIGTRSAAFPRLMAYAYFTYVIGGCFLYVAFLCNTGPDAGWFAYTPLSGPQFSPGKRVDVWAQLITFTELSALAGAVNLVVTVLKHRAAGMSLDRIPLLVWSMLVQSFMIIFAMPAVMLCSLMLALDRLVGTHFFNASEGGSALLWQHLFWFFGHPEVYIIFIPALGMLSTIIAVFKQRPVFGYTGMVLSLVATGFLGFGVWVHHMFATGIPQLGSSFFTAASILIALPTGIQFFSWIATLWGGQTRYTTAMLYAIAFFVVFLIGGLTGVMLASVPINLQMHDSFFVVAHFHYVLIGGAVFPLIGAVYLWFPKVTGRLMSERLGRWQFAFFFVGFNLVFFPMHILGIRGMPRRVFTYDAARGWGDLNLLVSIGSVVMAVAVLLLIINAVRSYKRGAVAGNDPWHADTLEWSVSSPAPTENFPELPLVTSRAPLWEPPAEPIIVTGVRTDRREVLITQILDGEPDHRLELAGPSLWPMWAALGTGALFITGVFTPWGLPAGSVLLGAALIGWFWPKGVHKELAKEQP